MSVRYMIVDMQLIVNTDHLESLCSILRNNVNESSLINSESVVGIG